MVPFRSRYLWILVEPLQELVLFVVIETEYGLIALVFVYLGPRDEIEGSNISVKS
jgi:hypothetical protein